MKQFTWQDYQSAGDKTDALLAAITAYRHSTEFRKALEANQYFMGDNAEVARKTVLKARKMETTDANGRRRVRCDMQDVAGNRIGSNFVYRFICQENCYLMQNGCVLSGEARSKVGGGFDRDLIALGEKALLHGTAWGFWNLDHIEVLTMAEDQLSGFMPIEDEYTGQMKAGAQFWQMGTRRPMYIRLFEPDGVTVLESIGNTVRVKEKKRVYRMSVRRDFRGEEVIEDGNWPRLPVIPLHANAAQLGVLTPSIKSKIDAYDRILSDFADNLDRANDVYWVLNNFGGSSEDVIEMLTEINRIKAVANLSDGMGGNSTAEPRTIEVPYAARQAALEMLEKALYDDAMAMNMRAIARGTLTNVAIRSIYADLDLKTTQYEWELCAFVGTLLKMLGCEDCSVKFMRQRLINESETVSAITAMRGDIDRTAALKLNPLLDGDELERLLHETDPA